MKCDESGATGECDATKKATFEEVIELYRNAEQQGKDPHTLHVDKHHEVSHATLAGKLEV